MNTRRNIKAMLIIFTSMFVVLCVYLVYTVETYGTRWFASPYNTRVKAQKNNVIAGDILDRNGKALAFTNASGDRVYVDDSSLRRATAHVVGDNYGQTFGAENFFSKYLLGFDQNVFERVGQAVSGKPGYGSDVVLTIDSSLSDYAAGRLGEYQGAIVVMNYKTGEIYALVNKPTFDPKYVPEYLNGSRSLHESAMVNRVTSGKYTPGSVFKIVTAVAALRYVPDIETRTFLCDGPLAFDWETGKYLPHVHLQEGKEQEAGVSGEYRVLRDYNGEYHGEIGFEAAFAKSCNHVFGFLAMEIGPDRLSRVAKELGVGDEFFFSDMVTASSAFQKGKTDLELSWSGVGQHTNIMTPLHMCMITAGIANDGVMMEPKLLSAIKEKSGTTTLRLKPEIYASPISKAEAEKLQTIMEKAVNGGTGRNAAIKGRVVGGKTGTAEVSSGEKRPNAWFAGYVKNEEQPLAICVVLEEGGSGGSNAAPIAGRVLQKALELGLGK